MSNIIKLITAASLLAGVGCASMTRVKKDEELAKVKKVAIVAFKIDQQQQADNLGLSLLKEGKDRLETFRDRPDIQKMARKVYADLAAQIQDKTGKKVVSLKTVGTNPYYKELYQQKMGGKMVTGIPTGGKNNEPVWIKGILNIKHFRALTDVERKKLAQSLGVDALVEYHNIQSIEQGWGIGNIMGQGDFQFTARSNIRMVDPVKGEPIFQIQNVDGKKTRDSSEISGDKYKKLATLGAEASNSSISEAVKQY